MTKRHLPNDFDTIETQEWLDAIDSVIREEGAKRAQYLLTTLINHLALHHFPPQNISKTPYRNTISVTEEERMPGDVFIERRIRSIIRWNAMAMVMRANQRDDSLGGHISTFSSSATLYDVGFNYFFQGPNENHRGDLIYFQGHSAPGIYARAYLEGRLTENQLDHFRQESGGKGLSSYPHPWLMPNFWQFPTVSMGLGPIQAIYQAHVMKYLINRGLLTSNNRKVWAFIGDGEMDEPESLGAISLAGREQLDNLIFVVNCNLQRLDGPVRGNGKIIQELESIFRGANWNVIKVIWGRLWDPLFAKDSTGVLQYYMDNTVDGEFQNYKNKGGAYTREHFFGKDPALLKLVEDLSDEDIFKLNRGGHDPYKVYAAYAKAIKHQGQPTVILAKTVKGYGIDKAEADNTTHAVKKISFEGLKKFRDRFNLPLSDKEIEKVPYYKPSDDAPEMQHLKKCRERLGGYLPQRDATCETFDIPSREILLKVAASERPISTTMALIRFINSLMKEKTLGDRIVPIVPDEARTFGMEGMFNQFGIYSSVGQLYEPTDAGQALVYKEDKQGRILEEGINEAGAFSAWMAVATSYSTHGIPMIPFYLFYSMFGFQRVGDLSWASGDMQARGFLIGATSGRTTLNGEGLQHQDGHSHIIASTIPNCVSYDPCYAYELAVIIHHGLERMYKNQENVFYYLTTLNENYPQPVLPEKINTEEIIQGMYLLQDNKKTGNSRVQLLGSGAILREAIAAAAILQEHFNVSANVWSVTSFSELRRDGLEVKRWNLLHPHDKPRTSYVENCLANHEGPVVAASDYLKLNADQIREFVKRPYTVLGTDGFGRSDTREKLRHFFEVDRYFIALAALEALASMGIIDVKIVGEAISQFNLDPEKINPMLN